MKVKLLDVLYILFFVLLVGVFFHKTIFFQKLPIPSDTLIGLYHPWRDVYIEQYPRGIPFKNFLITDPIRQQIPWRKTVIDLWKHREIPIWNPYIFSGTPLLGNIQAAPLYIFNILFLVFTFLTAWTVLIIIQPVLCGIFLYLYLRSKELSRDASIFASLIWSFSGFSIAWLTWGTILHVMLWLPLILLSIDKLTEGKINFNRKKLWLIILIFGLVSQLFAGHIQVSLYIILASFIYVIWQNLSIKHTKETGFVHFILKTKYVLVGGVLFLAISSVQWIPLLIYFLSSGRYIQSEWTNEGWFFPLQHLIQFIVPDFFGNPSTLNYWGAWNYAEFIGYIGTAPFIFALYALVFTKNKLINFWKFILIISLLLMISSPIATLPYILKIPIWSALQPTRLMVLVSLSLSILAAFGFHSWFYKRTKDIWWILLVLGLAFLCCWIFVLAKNSLFTDEALRYNLTITQHNLVLPSLFFIASTLLIIASQLLKKIKNTNIILILSFLSVIVFDLFRFGWKFTPFTPIEYFFPSTKSIQFLQQSEKPFRVMSIDSRIFPPNVTSFYGIETVEGYDPVINSRYEELVAAMARNKPDISPPYGFNRIVRLEQATPLFLSLFNIRYVLSLAPISAQNLVKVFEEGETKVYENTKFLPRAYFAASTQWVTGKEEVLKKIFDTNFDPAKDAIIETTNLGDNDSFGMTQGTVKFIEYSENKIVLETDLPDRPNDLYFLVLTNAYSPSWIASTYTVDRSDAVGMRIHRVNYLFMGIYVSGGRHIVEFKTKLL